MTQGQSDMPHIATQTSTELPCFALLGTACLDNSDPAADNSVRCPTLETPAEAGVLCLVDCRTPHPPPLIAPKTPAPAQGWPPSDATQLHFVDMLLQVTSEERSLAAAMRWQDELTSRGCLLGPGRGRAPHPLMTLANLDPGQLALLQQSESKLLSAAAAAQARASVPTSSLLNTPHAAAPDTAAMSSDCEQANTKYHDRQGTQLRIIETDNTPSMQAEESAQAPSDPLEASSSQCTGKPKAAALDSIQQQASPEAAQLACLPFAKGHCLMSYPSARPQSPMRHPSTRGDLLNGVHTSKMLSVRPFTAQSQRPSTTASILDAFASSKNEPADACEACEGFDDAQSLSCGQEDRHPAVLLRCSQPSAVMQMTTSSQPESKLPFGPSHAQTSQSAANKGTVMTALYVTSSGSWERRLPVQCR